MANAGEGDDDEAAFIRFRLSHLEVVQSKQRSEFDNRVSPFYPVGEHLRAVPEIRIYGATPRGQRVVAHVHGALPYVYIEYKGELDPESVNTYIKRLGRAINSALSLSFKRPAYDKDTRARQFVAFIVICKGTPFYGFHVGHKAFLKIYITEPRFKSRLSELLRAGAIFDTNFDVFEDHIPFPLQFMLDANLYGCGWVEVESCKFRRPLPEHVESPEDFFEPPSCTGPIVRRTYSTLTVPESHIHESDDPPKISYCTLELDLSVASILNRTRIAPRNLHQDFNEFLHPELVDRGKLVHSVRELWEDERRRCAQRGESGPQEVVERSQREWDEREPGAPVWRSEPTFREKIAKRAEDDLLQFKSRPGFLKAVPTFENFVSDTAKASSVKTSWMDLIRTTFEQVDAVHPRRMERDEREEYPFGAWAVRGVGTSVGKGDRKSLKGKERDSEEFEDVNEAICQATQGKRSSEPEDDGEGEAEDGVENELERERDEELDREAEEMGMDETVDEPMDSPVEERKPALLEEKDSAMDEWDREGVGVASDDDAAHAPEPQVKQEERESKRVKRESPAEISTSPSPAISRRNSLTPKPSLRRSPFTRSTSRNPFASPTKAARVRFATEMPMDVDGVEADSSGGSITNNSDDVPTAYQPIVIKNEVDELNLDDLPSDAFDDYQPTPTLVDPAPSIVPENLPSLSDTTKTHSSAESSEVVPQRHASHPLSSRSYVWSQPPPSSSELVSSMDSFGRSRVVYKDPHYSNRSHVPKPREYGGRLFKLQGSTFDFVPPFTHWDGQAIPAGKDGGDRAGKAAASKWEFLERPPTRAQAEKWLVDKEKLGKAAATTTRAILAPQIEGPTQVNSGFKFVPAKGAASSEEKQHLAILAIELQINTREGFLPDPEHDDIASLFYCLQTDNEDVDANGRGDGRHVGVIAVKHPNPSVDLKARLGPLKYALTIVDSEHELVNIFIDKVRYEWDPEIVAGYEVHNASWGYLIERAERALEWNLVDEFGRLSAQQVGKFGNKKTDRWGFNESTTLNLTGRHVFPIWRILRADNRLQQYTFEHAAFHVLRQRTPRFSSTTLTQWYMDAVPHQLCRVFEYWRNRVEMDIEMLEEAEVISQNCESARVFGVDFKSVRTRGSQFKVESVMFRIAKPESFLLLSPNRAQVGKQNAAECQPLVMEPRSAFYKGPLLVLDFQSLYPSVMIAYNYCYSTCLGRIGTFKGTSKLGTTMYDPDPGLVNLLKDEVNVSPNGLMFVKEHVRRSLLAKMLKELLDTRVMVKGGMKGEKSPALVKLLNARQLALKYLANVTYGYTSATLSGRMPCVEIADAIVQTGRETLERSLETIRATKSWGAEVVYGDTDSLFVHLPGRSKADAFRIGNEIADTITSSNPRPIKLKFEKVYLPSVLLAKKRYVGFKYEYEKELEPEFDAKGIETVRRDGIPAVQKMQEACLKILFRTSDLSLVREYCMRQWKKVMSNNVSPQDFTYAKEVRMGTYSEKRAPPPGAGLAARLMVKDKRAEPAYGDRVPYILTQAEPGTKQVDRAVAPGEFLAEPRFRLDWKHYIENAMIPPLERIFNLVGADVRQWYKETPRPMSANQPRGKEGAKHNFGLDEFLTNNNCAGCGGASGPEDSGSSDASDAGWRKYDKIVVAHGVCGFVAWQVVAPAGVTVAAIGRSWGNSNKKIGAAKRSPLWFRLHWGLQLGVVVPLTVATVALGTYANKLGEDSSLDGHKILGFVILCLMWLQIGIGYNAHLKHQASLLERPPGAELPPRRRASNYIHILLGIVLLSISGLQVTLGLYEYEDVGQGHVARWIWVIHWIIAGIPVFIVTPFFLYRGISQLRQGTSLQDAFLTRQGGHQRRQSASKPLWLGTSTYRDEMTLAGDDGGEGFAYASGRGRGGAQRVSTASSWPGHSTREEYESSVRTGQDDDDDHSAEQMSLLSTAEATSHYTSPSPAPSFVPPTYAAHPPLSFPAAPPLPSSAIVFDMDSEEQEASSLADRRLSGATLVTQTSAFPPLPFPGEPDIIQHETPEISPVPVPEEPAPVPEEVSTIVAPPRRNPEEVPLPSDSEKEDDDGDAAPRAGGTGGTGKWLSGKRLF
ncbi:hypothetical protein MNV49_001997 [Pseudohyphozyma bogoriensis]|nr:hypothetical protein MNV49_001997 [Pseudohyphozyma bogoriensis]